MKRNSVCASWFFCISSVEKLHCITLLSAAALKFPVFCCSATLIQRRWPTGNCRPLLLLLYLWSETLFAHVHSFAFLQWKQLSIHCTALLCYARPPWSMPSFAAVQRWCGREDRRVIAALYYCYCFYEAKLCLRKLILLISFSQYTPLHYSVSHDDGDLEVCRLLLQCNADIEAKTSE